MSYHAILDRTPVGRDEVEGFQTWLRRHDEYESHGACAGCRGVALTSD